MKWYAGAALLLLLALVFQMGLLAYTMYVLLGLLILTRLLARLGIEKVTAKRRTSRRTAEVGETATVRITIRNLAKLPVPWVLVEDLLPRRALAQRPPRLEVQGRRLKLCYLKGEGEATLKYDLTFAMRGYYQIGPLVLESGDLFGLHRRYRVGTEPEFVLVYPKVIPLEGYDLASRRPLGEIRLVHRLFEDPTRIAGVRYYQPGDPLNRVHWRATARTLTLHSKVYEPSTIAGATILLDFHRRSYHRRGEPYRSELAVTTAASLASAVYQMGQQVGLVTNGRDAAHRIREEGWDHDFRTRREALASAGREGKGDRLQPLVVETRRGPEQLRRILETLARVELTDGLTFAQLVIEASARLPRDATVVAILSDVTPETALALGNLRRMGYAVTAVLVLFSDDAMEATRGRLIAEGLDVRHLKEEAEIGALCQRQVLR
jgi:uncharacterized repeat protein (TIGR01451 family)